MKQIHLFFAIRTWLLIARFHYWFNAWYGEHCPIGTFPPVDFDDLPHYCGDCGAKLQHVRPGKWQCDNQYCLAKREYTVKGWRHL